MPDYDFNYRSGSGDTFIGARPAPDLARPIVRAFVAAPQPLRKIRFETSRYAPNHVVTIRSSSEGWANDTFGAYRDGAWEFFFEIPSLPPAMAFKFMLDCEHWMQGADLNVATNVDHSFDESTVQFPSATSRFQHGYDNFQIDRTKLAQDGVPRNTREDIFYDVIIIGSGMGGGSLADALSDAGIKTLVLEAGGLTLPTHMTNLPGDWSRTANHHRVGHFVNEPGSDFLPGVHLSFGGRSVYWSGLIPRMHDWELSFWPDPVRNFLTQGGYEPAEQLLRKTKRLGPFQDQVVAQLKADLPEWHVEDLPRSGHQPFLNEAGELESVVQDSTGMFSTADLLLSSMGYAEAAGRNNLTINLGHLVTRIATEGTRATDVVCEDLLGNTTRRYRGKFIVLAAGSLESARIALNSSLSNPNGLLGVGLTDHPAFFSALYTIPNGSPFGGSKRHAKVFLFKKTATFQDHPFNVELVVNPELWQVRNSDDDLVPVPDPSKIKMTFSFASLLDNANRLSSPGVGRKLSVNVRRNQAGVAHFDAARATRNTILDSLGIPFTANEGMGYGNEGTVHHAGGTMRMSGNASGVVDTNLKFEAYDNLYCADPAVWPFIPAANPSLTLVALSLRLADHLRARI
ncbi:Paromamine 6'-oxidase [Luteitalea pratensis]|uniref:Paromamine 6'-oxidase n=1 Tax=Luteitalea pratensis TaxID=1855912 RepID=A0A143PMK8_LUTPR|nr:GMC oxidoreductase [Luteitalea pratensis]AMY09318.1 Paromamine 6'-oxidase [Luteitalea pratensis]